MASLLLLLSLGFPSLETRATCKVRVAGGARPDNGYVGSKMCAECHQAIYRSFTRTDMGRSMSTTASVALPAVSHYFDAQLNRHFSVSLRQGQLYQTEWETDENGKDLFRDTQPIEWLLGAGANGFGALVRRGDHILEAPLTFYAKTRSWALSPGYEDSDRGFSRPIDSACIVCHSGRPNPVPDSPGQFRVPAFDELAIGCENCHGPGGDHVREMRARPAAFDISNYAIVNPGKLPPWLSDNICMSCHQTGDARVLQPGKKFQDFRPGRPLDHTVALLMVPPTRESPPAPISCSSTFR